MTTLVFFLEELSAQVFLESFLPGILPDGFDYQFIVFEGKSDLDKRLAFRLREWKKANCRFIVLRDQDSANCKQVKTALLTKCIEGKHSETLVRIACHELESWYLGDLQAVQKGLNIKRPAQLAGKAKYRNPDDIEYAAEELKRITDGRYQKVSGSREIGKFLSPEVNKSHSFQVFYNGLQRLVRSDDVH